LPAHGEKDEAAAMPRQLRLAFLCILTVLGMIRTGASAELRLGMIGLDTSHVIAFTQLLHDSAHKNHVPGGKVVAAFKGGSPDVEASASRVDGYTRQLQEKFGVKLVPSIEELCREVDAVLLESVDGRPHLAQARPVIQARKPLFIDKPVAGSLRDALEIYRLASENRVPVFSSSSYRFDSGLMDLKKAAVGEVRSVISYGPAHQEPHHPDLFWYGVHPAEALYTILGRGCQQVVRTSTPDTDVVTGIWSDGRVGTLHAIKKGATPNQVRVFGTKAVLEQKTSGDGYTPLVREIIQFFQTGVAPVSAEETVELFAFMEAADESKRQGGTPVKIEEVMRRNRGRE
jgi:predicted dehydrogenase